MEIRNMTEQEASILQNVVQKMQEVSPRIACRTFNQDEEHKISDKERLEALEQKVDKILSKLDLIFGNAVLVDGRFKHFNNFEL